MAPHCFSTIIIAEDTVNPVTNSLKRKRDISDVGDIKSSKRSALKDITNKASQSKREPHKVAVKNRDNLFEAPQYAFDIFENMKHEEKKYVINPSYMTNIQDEVTPKMRSILVDWMTQIHEALNFTHETLYISVQLMDLYMQKNNVKKSKLQIVGATCMWIAAKFEEKNGAPLLLNDMVFLCNDVYSRKEFIQMEQAILKSVNFCVNVPISYRFQRRFAKCASTNMKTLTLARYILELSLQNFAFVGETQSKMAAASLWLAFKMTKSSTVWDETLVHHTSYEEKEVKCLAKSLNTMLQNMENKPVKCAVCTKYSHKVFYEVAKVSPLAQIP